MGRRNSMAHSLTTGRKKRRKPDCWQGKGVLLRARGKRRRRFASRGKGKEVSSFSRGEERRSLA